MCGFVALLDPAAPTEVSASRIERMLSSIVHRGPDDAGTYSDGAVSLGFRRLSILDLSPAGHQPMSSDSRDCTIVFNGEIYNFLELRAQLEASGHRFRSHGDTEVLLAAYQKWGADCLSRLNGMWAFVIHDRRRGLLFGSRDRFGIKPLFRLQQGTRILLASEIKAIRASGLHDGALNLRTCADHLYDGRLDEADATFFDGIVQIPAGHAFELKLDGSFRQWAYHDVLASATPNGVADPAASFADLFEDAVRVHMRSDVPVGVNLSGGLDSTSILCAAARVRNAVGATGPLLAFCYQDRAFDESRYIEDTLRQTGAELVRLEATPVQLWDTLPTLLSFQDEPVHSMTALVGYQLMKLAISRGVKVILNGQGADEVLGGYGSYFHDRWSELIRGGRWGAARDEIATFTAAHGGSATDRFRRALRYVAQSEIRRVPGYGHLAARRRRKQHRQATWLRPELAAHTSAAPDALLGLNSVLSDALRKAPLPLYLRVEDRNSMAHSVEVRLPFLDHRLVAMAFGLGSEWKLRGPWNKYVLREAMRGRIPESVRSRVDKMGFPTDMARWFREVLHDRLRDIIHDPGFKQNDFFDAEVLAVDLQAHREGRANLADRLFAAVQFHLWQQTVVGPASSG